MTEKYPGVEYQGIIADKSSALKSIGFGGGSVLGPLFGGFLYDSVGFQCSSTYMIVFTTFNALLFFFFIALPSWRIKETIKDNKK